MDETQVEDLRTSKVSQAEGNEEFLTLLTCFSEGQANIYSTTVSLICSICSRRKAKSVFGAEALQPGETKEASSSG